MNYQKIYDRLIKNAQSREIEGYFERHHIVPRCMGGSDDKQNIVKLTAREHFIAHLLLFKIHPTNLKLVKAIMMMCVGHVDERRKINNRLYERLRLSFSQAQSECQSGNRNSQFGSQWIYNPLTQIDKKIKNSGEIPQGWVKGRYVKPKLPRMVRIQKKNENEQLYTNYHKIYVEHGFNKFVELTNYNKSQVNLVQMFKRHVKDFVPQNGKKR